MLLTKIGAKEKYLGLLSEMSLFVDTNKLPSLENKCNLKFTKTPI